MIKDYKSMCELGYKGKLAEYKSMADGIDDLQLTFIITEECNLRCTYCYEKKNPRSMLLEDGKKLIEKAVYYEDNLSWWNGFFPRNFNRVTLVFFGGEALLELDKIDAICSYFVELCEKKDTERFRNCLESFTIRLSTNGVLLKTKKCRAFLDKWKDHVWIDTTIDGIKEFHDACRVFKDTGAPTFDIVYNNILWLKKEYPTVPIHTKGTTTPETVHMLFDSYVFLSELFPNEPFTISAATGIPWDEKAAKIYKEQLDKISDYIIENNKETNLNTLLYDSFLGKHVFDKQEDQSNFCRLCSEATCYLVPNGVALSADGKIYHCMQFSELNNDVAVRNNKRMYIGTIENGIEDEGLEFMDEIRRTSYQDMFKEKCAGCTAKAFCKNAGCCYAFTEKFRQEGTLEENNEYNCITSRAEAAAAIRHHYLLEKKKWNQENR